MSVSNIIVMAARVMSLKLQNVTLCSVIYTKIHFLTVG